MQPTTATVSVPIPDPALGGSAFARALLRLASRQATPVIIATLLLLATAAIFVPRSLSPASVVAILVPAGITTVAALGQTLVIQQKGIDLSVGAVMTLAAVTSGMLAADGMPFVLVLLISIAVAALAGVINGVLVTWLHITPLLATLASNSLFIGVVWTVSGGRADLAPAELRSLASASLIGLPLIAWLALALTVVVAVVMAKSVFGRRFTAAGASPAAALAGGVDVRSRVTVAYVVSGAFGGIAGLLLAGYAGQTNYDLGVSYMLPVIAAVVIGGANLAGGRGSAIATAAGCVLLSLVVQVVLTLGAPPATQLLVQSLVLALAASIRLLPWHSLYLGIARRLPRRR